MAEPDWKWLREMGLIPGRKKKLDQVGEFIERFDIPDSSAGKSQDMSSHDPRADYNAIADRVYIEGWALALIFGAVDQALQHSWPSAALCAVMSAFCQFVVIRWSAWIKAHPDNPILKSANAVATDARWWAATMMVFLAYLAVSPYVEQRRLPFAWQFGSSTPIAQPPKTTEKIRTDATPTYLMDLYAGKMTVQGDRLAAPYIGTWLHVTSEVYDISHNAIWTYIKGPEGALRTIVMSFDPEWSERLSVLVRQQTINANCQIAGFNDSNLALIHCELESK